MDQSEVLYQRTQRERKSAAMQKGAMQDPRKSVGKSGWSGVGSGTDNAAPKPGDTDGGLSTGVLHSEEQESGIQEKAAHGITITNDDLDYMGHMAHDRVMKQGHNVGFRTKGPVPISAVTGAARRGFRKLPGTPVPQMGEARIHYSNAATGLKPPRHEREAIKRMSRAMKAIPIMAISVGVKKK